MNFNNKKNKIFLSLIIFITAVAVMIFGVFYYRSKNAVIVFPRDEGAHQDKYEGWYFNGFLNDKEGKEYAIIFSFSKEGGATVMIIDRAKNKYYVKTFYAGANFDIDTLSGDNFYWKNRGRYIYQIWAEEDDFSMKFHLEANKKKILYGENGLLRVGESGYMYYYSLVDTFISGEISIDNKFLKLSGKGITEHLWGDWDNEDDIDSWEWANMQLDNGAVVNYGRFFLNGEIVKQELYYLPKNGKTQKYTDVNFKVIESIESKDNKIAMPRLMQIEVPGKNGTELEMDIMLNYPDNGISDLGVEVVGVLEGRLKKESFKGNIIFEKFIFLPEKKIITNNEN